MLLVDINLCYITYYILCYTYYIIFIIIISHYLYKVHLDI